MDCDPLEKIRCIFFRKKEYFPLLGTALLTILSFLLLNRHIEWSASLLLLLSGIIVILSGSFKQRLSYLVLLGIFTCFEKHFILHYGAAFSEIGTQALITLHITDPDEIKAYLKIFKVFEYVLVILFAAGCCCEIFMKSAPVKNFISKNGKSYPRHILFAASFLLLIAAAGIEIFPSVFNHAKNWKSQENFYKKRGTFNFNAVKENKKPLTVVLVIGESHRKDVFDRFVFGPESRTPFLKKARQNGLIWEFDDMITPYQQTYFSVFTLLSRRGDSGFDLLWPEKGLFGLFREAGFKTTYITYQKKNPELLGYNFVVNEADNYINHRQFSGTKFDHGMLKPLQKILDPQKAEDRLIVLKMVGVHFHYMTRHPAEHSPFTPCYDRRLEKSNYRLKDKQLLINSYCNAMTFNVTFLDEAAKIVHAYPGPAVMVFVSDHGIINYDDNKNVFFGAAKSNFHIPCFIYGNEQYRLLLPEDKKQAVLKNKKLPVTNSYIFDTIASLAGVTYPGKRRYMDLTTENAQAAKPRNVWVTKHQTSYDRLP